MEPDHAAEELLSKFKRMVEWPSDLKPVVERMSELREYVHTLAHSTDTEDCVGTNLLLRTQYAILAQTLPLDPAPSILPREWMPPAGSEMVPVDVPVENTNYAKTHELLIRFQQEQTKLADVLKGAAQDALTVGMAWIKLRWQSDFMRDPIGFTRENDTDDTVAKYEWLRTRFAENEFGEESAEFKEMQDAEAVVRRLVTQELAKDLVSNPPPAQTDGMGNVMLGPDGQPVPQADPRAAKLTALQENAPIELEDVPEVSKYMGPDFDLVDAEDIRWEWGVSRIEAYRKAKWMAHRVFMYPADIEKKYGLTTEESSRLMSEKTGQVLNTSGEDDTERTDAEQTNMGRRVAVWELWDRESFHVYVWCEGVNRFLDDYIPAAAPRRFYPFFLVAFNRVTGRFIPPSDVELMKALQDEYNQLRTLQREAQRAAFPKYLAEDGIGDPGVFKQIEQALPYSITPVKGAGKIAEKIYEFAPVAFRPELYDRSSTLLDIQLVAGLPMAALGAGSTGGVATEAAIANEQMGVQTDHRRAVLTEVLKDIYVALAEMNAQLMPFENVAAIVGPGAVWPEIDRTTILSEFMFEVDATLADAADRKRKLGDLTAAAGIITQLGLPINPVALAREVVSLLGMRGKMSTLIASPVMMQAMAAMGLGPQAGGGKASQPNPDGGPEDQGPEGAKGGGKPMTEPPAPESVNNSPA